MDGGNLPKRQQAAGKTLLCEILSAETRWEAERRRDQFARWCAQRGCPNAAAILKCLAAHYNLALALDKLGQHMSAAKHFKMAADLGQNNPEIQNSGILKAHLKMLK